MANTASGKEVTCPNEETSSGRDLSQLDDREYLLNLKKRIEHRRVPLSGDLAITHRCNLKCVHCYLGLKRRDAQLTRKELNTAQFLSIIDDLVQAGCLFLLITGGEPLIREDFDEIYRYAKTRGLLVTVFTNGTLVNDQILRVFEEFPPWMVEVSLYGATAATYEEVTGVKGSYKKCLSGIERLVERKINLTLKTVLMSLNRHEFSGMQRFFRVSMATRVLFNFGFPPKRSLKRSSLTRAGSPNTRPSMNALRTSRRQRHSTRAVPG